LKNQQALNKKFRKELSSGSVALVLLSILVRSEEPLYGYQIGKLVGAGEEDGIMVKQGAIYPVLRSLESSGLLSSRKEASTSGPPRRYYSATDQGREILKNWRTIWEQNKIFIDHVLEGEIK